MSTNHNLFAEKGEPKQNRAGAFPLTSLTPYRQAKPAHQRETETNRKRRGGGGGGGGISSLKATGAMKCFESGGSKFVWKDDRGRKMRATADSVEDSSSRTVKGSFSSPFWQHIACLLLLLLLLL